MLIALLLALALPGDAEPLPPRDGKVCVGLQRVTLIPGEAVTKVGGPDFDVYRFADKAGESQKDWSVYVGGGADARPDGPALIERDGFVVRKAMRGDRFAGWLAQKGVAQLHFFGPAFAGSGADAKFFDRIDFSPTARAFCKGIARSGG